MKICTHCSATVTTRAGVYSQKCGGCETRLFAGKAIVDRVDGPAVKEVDDPRPELAWTDTGSPASNLANEYLTAAWAAVYRDAEEFMTCGARS